MWIPQPKGKLHPLYELSKIVMFFEATKDNWQSCPKYNSFFKKRIIFNFHFPCWSLSEENGIFLYLNRDSFFAHCYAWASDELYWKLCKNLTILWTKYSGHIHFIAPFIFHIMANVQNSSSNFKNLFFQVFTPAGCDVGF